MERKYAYMVAYKDGINTYVMYHLGRYCIATTRKIKDKEISQILKQYKTLSGAENYLLKEFSYAERNTPNIKYATKEYIKKGEYWKN